MSGGRVTMRQSRELLTEGLELGVTGFAHDVTAEDAHPTQVWIEIQDGLNVYVWNGGEDPATTVVCKAIT